MSIVAGYDITGASLAAGHAPPGAHQLAGYTTGSQGIAWTAQQFGAHPGTVRICQDSGSDDTADVLDVERYAATDANAADWVPRARVAWRAVKRPGQRWPAIYKSASGLTSLVNTLIAAGITSGVGLWVANWNLTDAQAVADVQAASGPFPVIGVQYASQQYYDTDVWDGTWLASVSKAGPYPHTTDGKHPLEEIAAGRGMTLDAWLALQQRLNATDAERLLGAAVPPAGMRYWSVNP